MTVTQHYICDSVTQQDMMLCDPPVEKTFIFCYFEPVKISVVSLSNTPNPIQCPKTPGNFVAHTSESSLQLG